MKPIATGSTLGQMILDTCGIPSEGVQRVEVVCEAGCVATINVHYVATISMAQELVKAVKQFRQEAV